MTVQYHIVQSLKVMRYYVLTPLESKRAQCARDLSVWHRSGQARRWQAGRQGGGAWVQPCWDSDRSECCRALPVG